MVRLLPTLPLAFSVLPQRLDPCSAPFVRFVFTINRRATLPGFVWFAATCSFGLGLKSAYATRQLETTTPWLPTRQSVGISLACPTTTFAGAA